MATPPAESISAQNAPPPQDEHPFSCSTYASNDVNDHLRTVTLTGQGWNVCSYIHRQTFGFAVAHQRQNESELTCKYDLAKWSLALGINKSTLLRIVQRLADCQIILLDKTEGKGTITWNLNYAAWTTYDVRHPKKQQAIDLSPKNEQPPIDLSPNTSPVESDPLNQCLPEGTGVLNQCVPAGDDGLKSMAACVETAPQEVPAEGKNILRVKNSIKEKNSIAPDGAAVIQPIMWHSGDTAPKLRAVPKSKPAVAPSHSQVAINASPGERLSEEPTRENRPPSSQIAEQKRLIAELQQKYNEANGRLLVPSEGEEKRRLRNLSDDARDALRKAQEELARMEAQEEPEEPVPPPEIIEEAPQAALVIVPDPVSLRDQLFGAVAKGLGYPLKNLNDGARGTVGRLAKECEQAKLTPAQALVAVQKFKHDRPGAKVWEFLSDLPKYASFAVAMVGGA